MPYGKLWAELIANAEAKQILPKILKQVKKGSVILSNTCRGYASIAAKGYAHRLVKHSKENFVTDCHHINGLEGIRGYPKRKLAAKGGIHNPDYIFTLVNMSGDITAVI